MEKEAAYVKIPAGNPEEAQRFYENVFCWNAEKYGDSPYLTFQMDGGTLTSGLSAILPMQKDWTLLYISCEDIPEMLEKIEQHGGKKLTDKTPIGEGKEGFFAHFLDSLGNKMGLWSKK